MTRGATGEGITTVDGSRWDVIVVGAGPAGTTTAIRLARLGAHVLIVDRKAFPRDKVCGCCLSADALDELGHLGLAGLPMAAGGTELSAVSVHGWGQSLRLPLAGGVAISRAAFDHALLATAMSAGVTTAAPVRAALGPATRGWRAVELRDTDRVGAVRARLVVAADGLGGRFLGGAALKARVSASPYVGVRALLAASGDPRGGLVRFAIARTGYVGIVGLAEGHWNVAAALRPSAVGRHGGLGPAVEAILGRSGLEVPGVAAAGWTGTPKLRFAASRLSAERVLAVGDAASFWEPFTGQGIAWALAGSREIADVAIRLVEGWDPAAALSWERATRRRAARQERHSRRLGALVQRPALARLGMWMLRRHPGLLDVVLPGQRLVDLPMTG